jgi:collagenase-like PrtC family protease
MNKKPELLATAASLEEAAALLDAGANALLIGDDRFGMRLAGHFTLEDTAAVVLWHMQRDCKIYAVWRVDAEPPAGRAPSLCESYWRARCGWH